MVLMSVGETEDLQLKIKSPKFIIPCIFIPCLSSFIPMTKAIHFSFLSSETFNGLKCPDGGLENNKS